MRLLLLSFLLFPFFSSAQLESGVSIYPNPATDVITIQSAEHDSPALVKILSETGELVWSQHENDSKFSLNLEHYPKGVYFVHIAVNNKVEVCRFIKK